MGNALCCNAVDASKWYHPCSRRLHAIFQASIFSKVGSIVCALVFLLRAIGDFKYVGIFKTIKHSTFAQNDSKWYSPLCLFLSFVYVLVLV